MISSFQICEIRSQPNHKVECVFPMAVVSMLPRADFGLDDHREDAPHFTQVGDPVGDLK